MFDVTLFYGIAVTEEVQKDLNRANPNALPVFINNDSEYLHECVVKGIRYIGKYVEVPAEMETFELLGANIESLVSKLIPNFSTEAHPLSVIATVKQPAPTT